MFPVAGGTGTRWDVAPIVLRGDWSWLSSRWGCPRAAFSKRLKRRRSAKSDLYPRKDVVGSWQEITLIAMSRHVSCGILFIYTYIYIYTWTSKRTKKSVQPLKRTLIASSYLNWWNEPKSWKRTLLAKRPEIWARKGPVAISISRMPLGTTDFPKWCAYDLFVLNSQGVCKCTQSTGPSRYCIWLFCFFSMSPKAWQCQISDLKPIT